jgi:hypothetical protein
MGKIAVDYGAMFLHHGRRKVESSKAGPDPATQPKISTTSCAMLLGCGGALS